MAWGCWSVYFCGWCADEPEIISKCGNDLGMSAYVLESGSVKRAGDEAWAKALSKKLALCFPGRQYIACEMDSTGFPINGIPKPTICR